MDTGARTFCSSRLLARRTSTSRGGETARRDCRHGGERGGRADTAAPGREEGQGAGQEGAAERGGDPAPVRGGQGDLPVPAQPAGAGGPHQCLRRHPRAVLGPAPAVRLRRAAADRQLPVPGRLRGPGQAEHRDHMPADGVQDQVPGQLLPATGQPRVRVHQPHLRLLRRMQAALQRAALEGLHRLLQLPPRGRPHRREDPVHARRPVPGPGQSRPHRGDQAARGRARPGPPLRPPLVRPRPRQPRLGRERPRRLLHLRRRQGRRVLEQARPRPHLPRPPGGGGRVRVLRGPAAGHHFLGAQLLRRVQQRRRADERRRQPALLLPDPQALKRQSADGLINTDYLFLPIVRRTLV